MAKSDTTLSLADEARADPCGSRRQRPRIEVVADELPPALRAEFVAAINDHTIPAAALARVLARRKITGITANAIGLYRRTKAPLA